MPCWDETSKESLNHGIPWVLTQEKFKFSDAEYNGELKGKEIDNPLRSFVLPMALSDDMNFPTEGDTNHMYAKPKGYETVRYPLSGLVGTAEARKKTKKHNDKFKNEDIVEKLNKNIRQWLTGKPPEKPKPKTPVDKLSVYKRYKKCLKAPNYTVFSNITSAAAWNRGSKAADDVIALEDPHNDVHLAVGGFDAKIEGKEQEYGIIAKANGDMGENNTAAMDPIFFFHHCNVDRMFWLWQKKNGYTDKNKIDVIQNYPGTSSTDSQGPTPGFPPNASLDLDTPLQPFKKKDKDGMELPYTSKDCIDIKHQLHYEYSCGSFDEGYKEEVEEDKEDFSSKKKLRVRGIDRALFQGSFILRAYAKFENQTYYLGYHSVLSRRNVVKCANCLTHLEVQAYFPLSNELADAVEVDPNKVKFDLVIHYRGPQLHSDLNPKFEIIDAKDSNS